MNTVFLFEYWSQALRNKDTIAGKPQTLKIKSS